MEHLHTISIENDCIENYWMLSSFKVILTKSRAPAIYESVFTIHSNKATFQSSHL